MLKQRVERAKGLDDKWVASTDALVAERMAHGDTKEKLVVALAAAKRNAWFSPNYAGTSAAHVATKAELAQAQEKLALCEAEMRRWIGMYDEESRKRVAVEMSCDAHIETIGMLESKLEDIRKAYANERAEHASTKSHDAAGTLHVAAARAEAIAERERAEEYLATVNGLLRRERERNEVQS